MPHIDLWFDPGPEQAGPADRLVDALGDTERLTADEVKARLKDEGVDADARYPAFNEWLRKQIRSHG